MNQEPVADAGVTGRDNESLAANCKSDVTDEAVIENFVNRLAIKHAAFRKPPQLRSFSWFDLVVHFWIGLLFKEQLELAQ